MHSLPVSLLVRFFVRPHDHSKMGGGGQCSLAFYLPMTMIATKQQSRLSLEWIHWHDFLCIVNQPPCQCGSLFDLTITLKWGVGGSVVWPSTYCSRSSRSLFILFISLSFQASYSSSSFSSSVLTDMIFSWFSAILSSGSNAFLASFSTSCGVEGRVRYNLVGNAIVI